jgi:hypothetical protein
MSQIYDVRCYMYADDLETAIEPLHRAQWAKAKLGSRTVFSLAYFTMPRAQIMRERHQYF